MKRLAWGCSAIVLASVAGCGSCGSGAEPANDTPAPSPATSKPFRLLWDGGFKRIRLPRDGGGFDGAFDLDAGAQP